MRFGQDHLIFKALCVVDEAAQAARLHPLVPPMPGVRFALAYLWAVGRSEDRSPYDEFWQVIQGIGINQSSEHLVEVVRGQSAQTLFNRIARGAGIEPTVALNEAMRDARGGHRDRLSDPTVVSVSASPPAASGTRRPPGG